MVADQRIILEGGKLIFTYGTLKQGFSNHGLLQDMIDTGDASFLGVYRTIDKLPLVCGPYKVPFLLNMPGSGDRVYGELYAVSQSAIPRMDELEGTNRGHYERLPIKVIAEGGCGGMSAEAYYAHRSYAAAMWKRNGEKGLSVYSKKETKGYVRRKDRPANLTFLDHINLFISSSSTSTPISSA
ncbi:putative gamma-glutamylcyclotransferase At3g02910 [Impatiens glandulifera]|uniref:putative gamma-glutamylcyclotransferase At3g02910 n=1 Tax=Impatiens glandulifera TaxID=253017 RepID=UPI001FB18A95|nr:putative gamma-glutamylcyclotransferase At3g02910 [Impatiens glandulifera]